MADLTTALDSYFRSIGCSIPDIDMLQPADPFLDTTGEDLRRRIFITQENSGTMLCLRPEFTIPVCLSHLENADSQAQYAYVGNVFRQRQQEKSEFTQAGFEGLGNRNRGDADINCIKTALGSISAAGVPDMSLVLGDQSIFMQLLDVLLIPAAWRKKLARAFGDNELLMAQLSAMSRSDGSDLRQLPEPIVDALESGCIEQLTELVSEHMVADGLSLTAGRTPKAIAERIMEKAELGSTGLEDDMRKSLENFLSIDVGLQEASAAIVKYEQEHGLTLAGAADKLNALCEGLEDQADAARFRACFGRRLDYYTGLVFEIYRSGEDKPVVGGGRYDHLMTLLGSQNEIPAVGFAIWVDRLGI